MAFSLISCVLCVCLISIINAGKIDIKKVTADITTKVKVGTDMVGDILQGAGDTLKEKADMVGDILQGAGDTLKGKAGCEKVTLSGSTNYQSGLLGAYTKTSSTCGGRTVYRKYISQYDEYFNLDYPDAGIWRIGPLICGTDAGLFVADTALYPEDITGTWQEYTGADTDTWVANPNIEIQCSGAASMNSLTWVYSLTLLSLMVVSNLDL